MYSMKMMCIASIIQYSDSKKNSVALRSTGKIIFGVFYVLHSFKNIEIDIYIYNNRYILQDAYYRIRCAYRSSFTYMVTILSINIKG